MARQFLNTGGSSDIDLQGVDAIFYLAGVSPYDFLRLKERIAPVSRSLRRELLGGMLGERFLLREHIGKIRAYRPACKHYFIGSPLMAASYTTLSRDSRCIVAANRSIINLMAQDYLFDAVFMPDAELLTESLLATREAYCARGREESERFQRQAVTKSDLSSYEWKLRKKDLRQVHRAVSFANFRLSFPVSWKHAWWREEVRRRADGIGLSYRLRDSLARRSGYWSDFHKYVSGLYAVALLNAALVPILFARPAKNS